MIVKINCLEYEYGILCSKTRSVDDILDRWVREGWIPGLHLPNKYFYRQISCPTGLISPSHFNSVDNIPRSVDIKPRVGL